MNFGEALEHARNGYHIARQGWNGKGMYVFLDDGIGYTPPHRLSGMPVLPFFVMKTAGEQLLPGWLASQSDMLADDWRVV